MSSLARRISSARQRLRAEHTQSGQVPDPVPVAHERLLLPGDPGFDEKHKDSLELLNAEFAERLKRQSDSGARVDAKAGVLGGFSVTAMTFQARQTVAHPVLGWMSVGAFGLAFLSAVGSLMLVAYKDTSPKAMIGEYVMLDRPTALARLVQLRLGIFEHNAVLHDRKVKAWVVSLVFLVVGFALTVGSVVHTGSHGAPEQRTQPIPTVSVPAEPVRTGSSASP